MKKYIESSKKVRFILAGSFNTALDFALLNTFVFAFGMNSILANTCSVLIGITISYFLNHYFVFRSDKRFSLLSYLAFFTITGFSSIVIQASVIYGFEAIFDSNFGMSIYLIGPWLSEHEVAQLNIAKVAAVGVGMVWNYILYAKVVFRN